MRPAARRVTDFAAKWIGRGAKWGVGRCGKRLETVTWRWAAILRRPHESEASLYSAAALGAASPALAWGAAAHRIIAGIAEKHLIAQAKTNVDGEEFTKDAVLRLRNERLKSW